MTWGVADAKAKFSEVLDRAENDAPQYVSRRKTRFVILTEEALDKIAAKPVSKRARQSAWDALQPSSGEHVEVEFSRLHSRPRVPKF